MNPDPLTDTTAGATMATTTPTQTSGGRPATASLWLLTSIMTRAARGRVRLLVSVLAALALGAVGLVVRLRAEPGAGVPDEQVVTLVATLVLTLYAPLLSLVQAAAVVGDLRDDGTLVYLWLRPVPRWRLALAAAVAVLLRSAPLAVLAAVALAVAAGSGTSVVVAAAYAALLACIGYAGLFSFLGLAVRRALVFGLVYVLVWEGVVGTFGELPARLAVSTYSSSLLGHLSGTALPGEGIGLGWAWAGPLVIAALAVLASRWRLVRGEVA